MISTLITSDVSVCNVCACLSVSVCACVCVRVYLRVSLCDLECT